MRIIEGFYISHTDQFVVLRHPEIMCGIGDTDRGFRGPNHDILVPAYHMLRKAVERLPKRKLWIRIELHGVIDLGKGRSIMKVNVGAQRQPPHGYRGMLRRQRRRL